MDIHRLQTLGRELMKFTFPLFYYHKTTAPQLWYEMLHLLKHLLHYRNDDMHHMQNAKDTRINNVSSWSSLNRFKIQV